jgi:hypothetical protein
MICLGLFAIDQGKTDIIDRTDRIDKSLFRSVARNLGS